jgi:hypothetical protein
MLLADQLRDRYPDFKLRMRVAIVESSYDTLLTPGVWLTCRHRQSLEQIVKNIDRISYRRETAIEQTILFSETIVLLSKTIQGLYFFNGHYSRLEPFHSLYKELVQLIPASHAIQLQIGFELI